jgi:hypothetical protein
VCYSFVRKATIGTPWKIDRVRRFVFVHPFAIVDAT